MKLTFCILLCLGGACVIIAEWYRTAPECQPGTDANGQPITKPRPTDHKLRRQLLHWIQRRANPNGRN